MELIIEKLIGNDEQAKLFIYDPAGSESRRVQETFFREKQTLIGCCVFGGDDTTKLVDICRLRLWIKLLKGAYYMESTTHFNTI